MLVSFLSLLDIYNIEKSIKNNEKAEQISIKAMNRLVDAEKRFEDTQYDALKATEKIVNVKKGAFSIVNKFVDVYSNISQIEFKDDIEKQITELRITQSIEQIKLQFPQTKELTTKQTFFSCLMGKSFFANDTKQSEVNIKIAEASRKVARAKESQLDVLITAYQGIKNKCDLFSDMLQKMNVIFMKSILSTEEIIEKNGYDGKNYSKEDTKSIFLCVNIAGVITELIRTPIFDENGELMLSLDYVIETNSEKLNEFTKGEC